MRDPLASLKLLHEHASAERDAALLALRQAEAALAAAAQQTAQLGSWREQFDARWGQRFRDRGASATLVQVQQGFGARLDQAITMQHTQQRQAQERLDAARTVLVEREQRVASVSKLIERRTREAQRLGARREQRLTDEAAQRARRIDPHPPLP